MAQVADPAKTNRPRPQLLLHAVLIGGAVGFFLVGTFFMPEKRLAIAICGLALLMAGLGLLQRIKTPSGTDRSLDDLKDLIFHDERCVFVVRGDGAVLTRNTAARVGFGAAEEAGLDRALGARIEDAGALVMRLHTKAARSNAVREEVSTARGRLRVCVHKMPDNRFFWAIEDVVDRVGEDQAIEDSVLPMMRVNATGDVTYMNQALRRIAGEQTASMYGLFKDTSIENGAIYEVETAQGVQKFQAMSAPCGEGRSEIVLIPQDQTIHVQDEHCFTLLEEFPVAMLRISPDGAIEDANKLARALLSIEQGAQISLPDLMGGLGRPIVDWLAEAAEGRALHQLEVLRSRSGDEEAYLQVVLGRVIEKGAVSLVALVTDATELKTLEAQFVQSQKMQAIGQLAGGVAHDFNNLLTAISGHCDLLMLRHDPGDMDYSDLEQINQNANRAASLVGQLLAFSRKQNLQLEVLDMRDTLSDLTHLLNRLVGAQIGLNLTHDPELMTVRADRRQLEQVIMNLVVNARDAMEGQGGDIVIETRNAKLAQDLHRDRAVVPRGNYVIVKVRDNGAGIPREKLAKIFEPFYTTKRTGEGTGLGLSTAYGIVKQSGGFIFVDSTEGKGTEFTIFFPTFDRPVSVEPQSRSAPPPVEVGPVDGIVLLVEDEAPVRAFASRALKLRGFQVLEAESGEEALEILSDADLMVDIVVTDVVMPGLDGPSWVREAREQRPDMKVVFVSGYAEENFAQGQPDIPNSIFLPKPFSLNELTATVRGQLVDIAA